MCRILFTKKGIESEVQLQLGNWAESTFVEVIHTEFMNTSHQNRNGNLIFTSANGAKGFLENKITYNGQPVFCVGEKAAKILKKHQIPTQYIAQNAQELADYIIKSIPKRTAFTHFCSDRALPILQQALQADYDYRPVEVYRTVLCYPKLNDTYDIIVFFSPSGVQSFVKYNRLENTTLFAIGETTRTALAKETIQPVYMPQVQTLSGLLSTLRTYLETDIYSEDKKNKIL